jgi:gliding motility-associated-like protein
MRDFIDSRCQDELLGGMEDCYDVTPVTLTLDIVGQGDVQINSIDITPNMVPYSGWYFMEVPLTLEAEEDYGLAFLYWEVVAGDVTISDVNNPLLELDLTGDVHLVAHFGIPVPPEEVSFAVSPAGSGFVILDGVTLLDNPHVDLINVGNHNLLAEPNEWWAFSHWTWNGNVVAPDAEASPAQFEVFEPGAVTAHFVEIPHTDLTVVVSPQQAGKVRVVDMAMVEDVWYTSFEPNGPTVFEAISEEEWQFSHWEVAVTTPLPEEKANPMALLLADVPMEIVTAHFEPVEFHLYVPNAFTPDNDGVNDSFQPLGSGFEGDLYRFAVFNRWGEVVFQTEDPDLPWIGQNNQRIGTHFVPDGVYGWRVEAQGYHELIPTVLHGTVTVVR